MSIVCPRSSAAAIASVLAGISSRSIGRTARLFPADLGERTPLGSRRIEILRRQPGLERRPPGRPLAVRDRVPGRVAVATLDHSVLPEDAFEGEAEPFGGAARTRVGGVALPLVSPVAQLVERIS